MTTLARTVILQVSTTLQDPAGIRWPATELVQYLNDGQRSIVSKRPDLKAARVEFVPVEGGVQTIPTTAMLLMDVVGNNVGRKKAITKVDLFVLEATQREWQSMAPASEFSHFMHDLREPRKFYLYPPARPLVGNVTLLVSEYPTDVPTPAGVTFSSVTGNLDVTDEWANALRDYVLYRAYSKDAEFGGNAQLAASYLQLFNAALGEQLQSTATVAPKS